MCQLGVLQILITDSAWPPCKGANVPDHEGGQCKPGMWCHPGYFPYGVGSFCSPCESLEAAVDGNQVEYKNLTSYNDYIDRARKLCQAEAIDNTCAFLEEHYDSFRRSHNVVLGGIAFVLLPCALVEDIEGAMFDRYIAHLLSSRVNGGRGCQWTCFQVLLEIIYVLRAYVIPVYISAATSTLFMFELPSVSNLLLNSLAVIFFNSVDDMIGTFLVFPEFWEHCNSVIKALLQAKGSRRAWNAVQPGAAFHAAFRAAGQETRHKSVPDAKETTDPTDEDIQPPTPAVGPDEETPQTPSVATATLLPGAHIHPLNPKRTSHWVLQRVFSFLVGSSVWWVLLWGPFLTNRFLDLVRYREWWRESTLNPLNPSTDTANFAANCAYMAFSGVLFLGVLVVPPYLFLVEFGVSVYCWRKSNPEFNLRSVLCLLGATILKYLLLVFVCCVLVTAAYSLATFWRPATVREKF